MTLKLTPAILKQAYDLLSITEPFSRWNLPDGEDVKFLVTKERGYFAWHEKGSHKHNTIACSSAMIGQIPSLLEAMAHEMIHVHMQHSKIRDTSDHGVAFKKFAAQICKVHTCFDPKRF